ncbi:prepilin-type N-terminal cleavage/methylation domain-containing protein [Campylobacter sp. 10_1_50]|jgi:transformation system protein|uniref:type II secretion system protein n=1 Tax=Campylobacter TaxID=194 RepID=UPI00024100B7|nr:MULTISPECIES: prepilin-type N-terminal cleavage/methylation domain-containing protein [Campylobacter]EHL89247.1 prepilin-type N-terminal cleavage/methylation domain-containing protein [Campylobacter sp. 10_1_50]
MRKGFSMIELIFVIVILGLLATVAVPRLTATRDDAEIAKVTANIQTLLSDLTTYYTSQGKFSSDISQMTNVPLEIDGNNKKIADMTAAGKKCIKFTLVDFVTDTGDTKGKPAVIKVEKGANQNDSLCLKILGNKGIEKLLNNQFKYINAAGVEKESETGEYPVSGLSVAF